MNIKVYNNNLTEADLKKCMLAINYKLQKIYEYSKFK